MSKTTPTGAGTRPTTDGTADNIGAGSGFNPDAADKDRPAPHERAQEKRADALSVQQDDSAPMALTEDADDIKPDSSKSKPV